MKIATTRIELNTDEGIGVADIGDAIRAFVASSGVVSGLCVLTISDTAAALSVAGDFEESAEDLIRLARRWLTGSQDPDAPGASADRADTDDPGLGSGGVLARCLALPLRAAGLRIGSWESVMLVDAAGPRRIGVDVTTIGN